MLLKFCWKQQFSYNFFNNLRWIDSRFLFKWSVYNDNIITLFLIVNNPKEFGILKMMLLMSVQIAALSRFFVFGKSFHKSIFFLGLYGSSNMLFFWSRFFELYFFSIFSSYYNSFHQFSMVFFYNHKEVIFPTQMRVTRRWRIELSGTF